MLPIESPSGDPGWILIKRLFRYAKNALPVDFIETALLVVGRNAFKVGTAGGSVAD